MKMILLQSSFLDYYFNVSKMQKSNVMCNFIK